jgi:hypothetical protein
MSGINSGTIESTGDVATEAKQDTIIAGLTAIETNQTDKTQFAKITDGTNDMTVNSEGRADTVAHSHPDTVVAHFSSGPITATQNYILVDISDTTNYKHVNTGFLHWEWLRIFSEVSANANYKVEVGYLSNVDATNGDFSVLYIAKGDNVVGRVVNEFLPYAPAGPRASDTYAVTSTRYVDDTAFQTDVNLRSTIDPTGTAATPSGNGDLAIRITVTAGTVDLSVNLGYHSHA